MTITSGILLNNRYRLDELIANGGMGQVWRAHDEVLGRDVAVKVLSQDLAADPDFVDRFRDEARHTASLSHPGIAGVHDYAETDGVSYLVMELVDGEPLSAVLARDGALSVERSLDLIAQVAVALQAAHDAGVVHRDIKPGNLLVRPDGSVKVTDFGIARAVEATSTRTQTGTVLGTAYYLSPEAARGEPATTASDVYSLGVVGYECLAGHRPFTATNPVAVATAHLYDVPPPLPPHVPREVTLLVLACMAKAAASRPTTAAVAERALALRAALAPTVAAAALAPDAAGLAPDATTVMPSVMLQGAPPQESVAAWRANAPGQAATRRILAAVGAVAVLLGFLLIRSCAGPASTATTPRPTATVTTPPLVRVVSASYVGKPVTEVTRALTALGLHPTTRTVTTTDRRTATGTVIAVTPTGSLRRGAAVTVTAAVQAPAPPPRKHHGKDKGGDG
ncbi:MAG: eukaryotic-like serine/threonine-protein kinase [Frankiaceae bacterium]|nr:eukaryotic-like serine/threonine-protein kinase [Frankiaceae bacterium]